MIERSPNIYAALLVALVGVLFGALAKSTWNKDVVWASAFLVAAAVCSFFAGFMFLSWASDVIGGRWMYLLERARRAAAITPASQLIEEVARLTPEQIAAARILHPTGIAIPQVAGPTLEWDINGLRISASFVNEYLDRCSPDYCYPVRRFSEGTPERLWATALVAWMVERRLATPASGNAPARFTAGRETVLDWFEFKEMV